MVSEEAAYGGELAVGHDDHVVEEALFARRAEGLMEPEGKGEGVVVAVAVSGGISTADSVALHEASLPLCHI